METTSEKIPAGRKPRPPIAGGRELTPADMVAATANQLGDSISVFRVVLPKEKNHIGPTGEQWIFDCITFLGGDKGTVESGASTRCIVRLGGDMKDFTRRLYEAAHGPQIGEK
jgi:hypothetical protein